MTSVEVSGKSSSVIEGMGKRRQTEKIHAIIRWSRDLDVCIKLTDVQCN
jgi:hypothetical protein